MVNFLFYSEILDYKMNTQSILFGNGLNRLSKDNPSWEELLEEIAKGKIEKNIPNTLRYEAVILKQPYREKPNRVFSSDGYALRDADGNAIYASGEVVESKLKKDIAQRVGLFDANTAYDIMAKLPVHHYLTTNYDNTLLKAIGDKSLDVRYRPEKIYSIRRRYSLNGFNGIQSYWPIHGNVDSPASIMLGFDHYCGALSKIESYVKGGYEMPNVGRLPSITYRLKNGIEEPYSWIDLFFISDIHIIGLGLEYEEMDLWWVLNRRRRIKRKEDGLVTNRVIYYPVDLVTDDKRQLLNGFDVEICDLDNYSSAYMSRYKRQLDNIESNLR